MGPNYRGPRPLATYLAVFLAIVVIPFSVVTLFITYRYAKAERSALENNVRLTQNELVTRVEGDFKAKISLLRALAMSQALDDGEDYSRLEKRLRALDPLEGAAFMLHGPDPKHVLINTRIAAGLEPPDAEATLETARRAAESRQPAVSDLFRGINSGDFRYSIALPVERNGEVRYVIAAVVRPTHIQQLLLNTPGLRPPLYASVADRDGRIIARSSQHETFVGKTLPGYDRVLGSSGTWSGINLQGIKVDAFYSRLEASGWLISIGIETAALEEPLTTSLVTFSLLALLLFALAISVAYLLWRYLAGGYRLLDSVVQDMSRGVSVTAPLTPVREANLIGEALANASAKIHEHSTALSRANDALEERVAERTRDLVVAHRKAEAAGRAKADFLANMSHELRTPLTAIMGASELLLAGFARHEPLKQRQYLEMQRDAGHNLLAIINDILDLSKIESGHLDIETIPFSLHDVANSSVELLRDQARRKGIVLSATIGEDVPDRVCGDPTRLRQVLVNLLSNAVKFTDRGRVRLSVAVASGPPDFGVRFSVEDTGVGIAPDRIGRLFERFVQADNSTTRRFGGTGLGLPICKRLVELMHGAMDVESRPGEGSTFAFMLGLPPDEPLRPKLVSDTQPTPGLRPGKRVLLAEDNRASQMIVGAMLRQAGHHVTVVANGSEAVEAMRASDETFDLLLMDVHMPEMDGYEATRRLRASGCTLPILALTANALAEEVERCLAAGMDRHLAKPVQWPVLFSAIDEIDRPVHPRAA